MISDKEIICPENLLNIAKTKGPAKAVIVNAGKKVAVFCHGMVTSVYLQTLWSLEHPFLLQPDYTGITRVQASSRGFRTVRSINETGHVRNLIERPKFGKTS